MDKGRRDVRRGANRFSQKQSGLISGFPRKSKKGGIFKKLGLAGEVKSSHEDHHQQEMVCEIEASTKKSKLPKRNFKDTNVVVHASVPRKLRSAMKKRKLESVSRSSLASKKLNAFKRGVGSLKDCVKKEKPKMECKVIAEPITKDEEEVVETLYALARMFPGTDSADKIGKSDDALPDEKEAKLETIKVAEVDSSLVTKAELAMADSREATVSAKTKQFGEMPKIEAENFYGSAGTLDFLGRLKQSSVHATESPQKIIDITFPMKAVEANFATSDVDHKSSGLALWPGLSSTVNPGAHVLSKPTAVKVPPWMGSAGSSSKIASFQGDPSRVQQKELKRCASHIYISRLIRVLQTSTSPLTVQQNDSRPTEVPVRDLRSVTNCLEKATRAGDAQSSQRCPNLRLLDKCRTQNTKLVHDMTQLAFELDGPQPSRKQSYDFLSLSSAVDSNFIANDVRNGSVSTSSSAIQSRFPLSNSITQHHPSRTFSMPQPETCHIPSAYNNRFPAASGSHQGRPQLSPYLPGPFAAAYHSQHQQFWPAAQYRAVAGNFMPLNQYAVLRNGGKPNHTLKPSSQTNSSIAALQAVSTRCNNVSQQQQRLMAAAAAMSVNHHPSRAMNRQEHHFPLVYEDTRTPLQLLCNEQS